MKKSLVSLAVAAVVAAPMAALADGHGANLYGSLRTQLVSSGGLTLVDGGSRLGIKGAHDLGNGMNAVYRLEYGFNTAEQKDTFSGRLGYVGLTGGFGGVTLGSQWSPYYSAVEAPSDIPIGGLPYGTYVGRASNALAYSLPEGLPVSGGIALVMADNSTEATDDAAAVVDDDDIDAINVGLSLAAGPVSIGLGMHDVEGAADAITGVSISGSFAGVGLAVLVEDEGATTPMAVTATYGGFVLQYNDSDADDETIVGQYTHGLGDKAKLQFAVIDNSAADDVKGVARLRVDF